MKFTRNQKIALAVGIFFIVIGVLQALGLKISQSVMNEIGLFLFIVAGAMLFNGKKKKDDKGTEENGEGKPEIDSAGTDEEKKE